MVQELSEGQGYPVELVCDLLGLPRSTYYYTSKRVEDSAVVKAVGEIVGQYPTYGKRRVTQQLRRPPYQRVVNHKRVQRVMRQAGLLQPVVRKKFRTTNSQHPYPRYPNRVKNLVVDHPDQVWVADITYIRLKDSFVFLAVVMDVFTRTIRGWSMSRWLDASVSVEALQMGLREHRPEIHHSDQGIQYAAREYTSLLAAQQVQISNAAVGQPRENGFAERLMRTIKEEEVDLSDYRDFADAQGQIGRFLEDVYNLKRIHSSLGYLTPVEFEFAYRLAQTQPAQTTPNKP
jgi:transposase InsO family protein